MRKIVRGAITALPFFTVAAWSLMVGQGIASNTHETLQNRPSAIVSTCWYEANDSQPGGLEKLCRDFPKPVADSGFSVGK